jgi:hypothetical protein
MPTSSTSPVLLVHVTNFHVLNRFHFFPGSKSFKESTLKFTTKIQYSIASSYALQYFVHLECSLSTSRLSLSSTSRQPTQTLCRSWVLIASIARVVIVIGDHGMVGLATGLSMQVLVPPVCRPASPHQDRRSMSGQVEQRQ